MPSASEPVRVLVVEDNLLQLRSMVGGLSRIAGVEVVGAASVGAAVATLGDASPGLVVVSLDVAGCSPVELFGELASRGLSPPVVFLSADLSVHGGEFPPQWEGELLEKPVSLARLREVVQRLVMPSTPDFDRCFEDGVSASLARRYPEALEFFRAALRLRPDDAKVRANVARLEELGKLRGW